MGLLNVETESPGLVNVSPRIVRVRTTDNYATITAANYLNQTNNSTYSLRGTDVLFVAYGPDTGTSFGIFTVTLSNGSATLIPWVDNSNVLLPVVGGDFAVFNGTSGQIKDLGYLPSNAAKTVVVMATAAVIANHIATYTDTAGTVGKDAATAINGGNLQAGLSGTAGTVASFPATAANGSLIWKAINNSGGFNSTVSNSNIGQATVYSLPDAGAATAGILVNGAALVSGNLIKASGTAGAVVDAGFAVKANTTASYGGGGTSNAFTATGLTSSSIVTAVILTSTNAVAIAKAVPSTNTLTVTFSADPGASTTVSWIAITPAV